MRNGLRLLFALCLFGGSAYAQDEAGIFFYGPPPSVDAIQKLATGATVDTAREGAMTRVTIAWAEVTLTINIDPNWDRDSQLAGIRGWLADFPDRDLKRPGVATFLANLDRTTTSYGSIIEPAYDREGRVVDFLKKLISTTGGFLFTYQSFYTAEGKRIIGLPDDPEELKSPQQ